MFTEDLNLKNIFFVVLTLFKIDKFFRKKSFLNTYHFDAIVVVHVGIKIDLNIKTNFSESFAK
jgi:hypothetical protein